MIKKYGYYLFLVSVIAINAEPLVKTLKNFNVYFLEKPIANSVIFVLFFSALVMTVYYLWHGKKAQALAAQTLPIISKLIIYIFSVVAAFISIMQHPFDVYRAGPLTGEKPAAVKIESTNTTTP